MGEQRDRGSAAARAGRVGAREVYRTVQHALQQDVRLCHDFHENFARERRVRPGLEGLVQRGKKHVQAAGAVLPLPPQVAQCIAVSIQIKVEVVQYALAFVGDCSLRTTRGAAKKAPESPHSHGTLHEANGSGVHEANAARCADVSL